MYVWSTLIRKMTNLQFTCHDRAVTHHNVYRVSCVFLYRIYGDVIKMKIYLFILVMSSGQQHVCTYKIYFQLRKQYYLFAITALDHPLNYQTLIILSHCSTRDFITCFDDVPIHLSFYHFVHSCRRRCIVDEFSPTLLEGISYTTIRVYIQTLYYL